MTPERYQRIAELYDAAIELDPEARKTFLDGSCGDDVELRRNVELLLGARDNADNYFAAPAMEVAAALIGEETMPSHVGKNINHYQSSVIARCGRDGRGLFGRGQQARSQGGAQTAACRVHSRCRPGAAL